MVERGLHSEGAIYRTLLTRLRSSVVEQCLHKAMVTGSNPVVATKNKVRYKAMAVGSSPTLATFQKKSCHHFFQFGVSS